MEVDMGCLSEVGKDVQEEFEAIGERAQLFSFLRCELNFLPSSADARVSLSCLRVVYRPSFVLHEE